MGRAHFYCLRNKIHEAARETGKAAQYLHQCNLHNSANELQRLGSALSTAIVLRCTDSIGSGTSYPVRHSFDAGVNFGRAEGSSWGTQVEDVNHTIHALRGGGEHMKGLSPENARNIDSKVNSVVAPIQRSRPRDLPGHKPLIQNLQTALSAYAK